MSNKKPTTDTKDLYVLGVGTSAGGMDALTKLLSGFSGVSQQLCVIIVQHLSPTYKSELASILARQCKWPVTTAEHGMEVAPHNIYVTPQNKTITFQGGLIHLSELSPDYTHAPSIDEFLISLAEAEQEHAIGMILSGTGGDGAKGIKAIKKNGGFALAQSPESAQYNDMPLAAIATNDVDVVLHPAKVFEELNYYIKNHRMIRETAPRQKSIDVIFELLSKRCGVDFSQYKPSTILRRMDKRIQTLHLTNITEYYQFIKKNPHELDTLFETVLIGVTEFFRDDSAFSQLKKQLKLLLKEKKVNDSIRVWSVGCATGEEAYSIAILLNELLGEDIHNYHIQIFASDIDERALSFARKGIYTTAATGKITPDLLEKYFDKVEDGYEIKKTIKQYILFSRHDITNDPPYVKLDLVVCRNLLIYFNNYLQKETLKVFNYALRRDGLLFLGKSESVSVTGELFDKVTGLKLFRKVIPTAPLNMHFSRYKSRYDSQDAAVSERSGARNMSLVDVAKETLYHTATNPFVLMNENGDIKESQGSLRLYLELSQGTMTANIFKMANQELILEVRSLLAQAKKTSSAHVSNVVRFKLFDKEHFVKMKMLPLVYPSGSTQYYLLEFEHVNPDETFIGLTQNLSAEEIENYRIKELEHEVQSLREHLQTFTEELESSNEEMQAINEELQSANEELKSSNEELETSNEELQSSNEELHTANSELRFANNLLIEKEEEVRKAKQVSEMNETLYRTMSENIPNGTIGILDDQLRIEYVAGKGLEVFNQKLVNLVGQYLPGINPSETERQKLVDAFTMALHGEANSIEVSYSERTYMLHAMPFQYETGTGEKVMYLSQEITKRKLAEAKMRENDRKFRTLADNIPNLCWMANADGYIYWYNSRWYEYTGTTPEDMEGWGWQSVHDPEVLPEVMKQWSLSISEGEPFEMVFPLRQADGVFRKFLTRIVPIRDDDNEIVQWFGTNTDITERESIAAQKDEFMGIASHELKTPVTSVKGLIQISLMMLEDGRMEKVQEILQKANHQVSRLTSLINDLLDVSKLNAGKLDFSFAEFPIGEVIEDSVLEVSGVSTKHQIQVTGDLDTMVEADKMRLEQVVTNLLTNAIKYSPGESKILVKIKKGDTSLSVSVIDSGIGISPDKQPFLFDRFYRVESISNKFQGMGMGLFICATIIKRHGGIIAVKSATNKGSEFYFSIPYHQ